MENKNKKPKKNKSNCGNRFYLQLQDSKPIILTQQMCTKSRVHMPIQAFLCGIAL